VKAVFVVKERNWREKDNKKNNKQGSWRI